MSDTSLRLSSGSGLIARRHSELVFIPDGSSELIEAFESSAPGDGLDAVTRQAEVQGLDAVADFVVIDWSGDVRLAVFGSVEVESDHRSLPRLSAAGAGTWVERSIRGVDVAVTVGVVVADVDPATDLRDGVTLAGSFALTCLPAPPPVRSAAPLTTRDEPEPPIGSERVDRANRSKEQTETAMPRSTEAEADGPAASPVVEVAPSTAAIDALASEVLAGTPAPDRSTYDATPDDVTIVPDTAMRAEINGLVAGNSVEGLTDGLPPLPPVPGMEATTQLVFADGRTEVVDKTLVIGRKPSLGVGQTESGVRLVQLDCSQVSSRHLEVHAENGGVSVTDLGSSNGSFVLTTGDGQLVQLEAHTPHRIDSGMIVQVGTKRFRLEHLGAGAD